MDTIEQLNTDLKEAIKSRQEVRKDTIRWIKAALQNAAIEAGKDLDAPAVSSVLAKLGKQYRDSIASYSEHGRADLAKQETEQLEILEAYLPAQMEIEEIRTLVANILSELDVKGPQDKGRVMARLMPEVRGKADGSIVNQLVSEALESLS